ncbi:short-chain dehydrogenase [Sinorhizobium meliloti]|uniref:NnrS family protein n=1 Tax=Rhizobium meliloti TaxID=382 RepID=UPI0002A5B5C1|nr:NnrS family protein [Sinorhizobium meliloti]TWA96305.1 uncharacterized protein involved in response to NO [Ensifer sp. SEMIA 134]TWB33930.1 uncharacterized protein involved in response to NO [Ensifer sp. SEMIA 135]AGA09458.1 Uncharacterized protein involved in response to NO [Sinorhizobium meliloti GR4]MDE3812812.1 NnrS family protein [Sinorhizobium meliloti]MDE3820392.1 NnrS family protein [Sinorhizobium meliloti]
MSSIWRAPYRPLFFLAGLWALIVPIVWLLPEQLVPDRVEWHSRELLFGMGGAAAGGYLLTALPAWTRGAVPPAATVIATCLWCAARLTGAFSDHLPLIAAAIGVSGYFAFLTAMLMRGVVVSRAWARCWAPLGTGALGVNAFVSIADGPSPTPLLFAALIVVVGGRAVPAFTGSWLYRTAGGKSLRNRRELSHLAVAGILIATCLHGDWSPTLPGLLLLFSGAMLLWQMSEWRSLGTRGYPALFILHVAFAWTPTALLLGGLSATISGHVPADDALHALTMGAMGTMIAAFMMRPAMVRDGESLILGGTMAGAFSLVSLSALLRTSGGWLDADHFEPEAAAAICWMAGWTLFLIAYLPAMSGPVPRPAFSAALGNQVKRGNGTTAVEGGVPLSVEHRGYPTE